LNNNYLQSAMEIISSLVEEPGVSGYEGRLYPSLESLFSPFSNEVFSDFFGNCYALRRGEKSTHTIMLAAHADEIGLMINYIDERGFLYFSPVGGIDLRTLLCQEVTVHGREDLAGVVCWHSSRNNGEKIRPVELANMAIDTGYSREKVSKLVNPGDVATIKREPLKLLNNTIAGKSLDDRAGIAVLAICLQEMTRIRHKHDIVAVATVQEEVGLRGALVSTERLNPDIAVAVDVTHAQTLDTKNQVPIQLGKGPVITKGPNIHPEIFNQLSNCAQDNRIPFQVQPIAGATGTDARVIQLTACGIPTGLLSIPLKYMHTSVETLSLQDIVYCGLLLANFISALPDNLEEILCY